MWNKAIILFVMIGVQQSTFKDQQLTHSRVATAYDEKLATVRGYFAEKNIGYNGYHLFLRALKKEQRLEAWVKPANEDTYRLLTTYAFCTSSGTLGPKRREGDLQIPEGIYHINHFNPFSNFYLSLGVSYPNASDRILSDKRAPGGAIYVHGNCVTLGCIPITDEKIKELYVMAVEARNNGQEKIPIHIYPTHLDENGFGSLRAYWTSKPELHGFWNNLRSIYADFERTRKLRSIKVNTKGEYYFPTPVVN